MANPVLSRLVADRDRVSETIDDVLGKIAKDERDPTDSERELLTRNRERLSQIEPQIVELVDLEEQRAAARDARGVLEPNGPAPQPAGFLTRTQPNGDEPVYRTFAEKARDELIVRYDTIAGRAGPGAREAATERLTRASVNTLIGDVPGLHPPQHLAQILEVISKSRPIVEATKSATLNSGKLTYPKITGRPTVAVQATEKTQVSSTKMTVALENVDAKVYAGSGDLSYQAVNWTTPDALALYFDLMAEAYAQATEDEAADVMGLTGWTAGPTPASDDLAGWYAAIAAAAGMVYTDTRRPANTIFASVPIGFRLLGLVSNASPTFGPGGTINLAGNGTVAGLRLVTSPGFTDPDVVYVADAGAFLTAEDAGAPVQLRAVEPSIAGFEVGVVGGFAAERIDPKAFVKLTPPVAGGFSAPEGGETSAAQRKAAREAAAKEANGGNGK